MANPKWDIKTNYMLAGSVCKYGLNPEPWNSVANDLADYIKITPQNCKIQFDVLCEQFGHDWKRNAVEPLHIYVFSNIKRRYYGDLCDRMTESRDLLMVMYDFIRLFRGGHITHNDINVILQDVKNNVPTGNNTDDNDRQQKIKMLERLKYHMARQMPQTPNTQYSSLPAELLPPPLYVQQQEDCSNNIPQEHSIINDRQVPSMNIPSKSNATEFSSFPVIIQSNNLHLNNPNASNGDDIDEIELSSDDDDDDDDNDRTTMAQQSNMDELVTSSNLIDNQDDSTFMSNEQETNESSNIPPLPNETSSSNDRDLYEHVSSTSVSNQSTSDTRQTSSINGHPVPSNLQLNASISGSSDYVTLDSDRLQSGQNYHPVESESNITTPRRIPVDDDEVARMDAEQIPEPIPGDITDITVPNDNAVFVIDELISSTTGPKIPITMSAINEQSITSENDESNITKTSRKQSQLTTSSTSTANFRKSVSSVLTNLKNAKYGPDFAKSLQTFKLPTEYYFRIKKPLDIPEIRERMNNGDYDDNILLFERDILLMFTNALSMYHRDFDIHNRAKYMVNYAMELFTPIEEVLTPWKMDLNNNDGESSSVFHNDNDSTDTTLNPSSSTRTPSIASTSSSSARMDSSRRNLRNPPTSNYPMSKRQRKTTD